MQTTEATGVAKEMRKNCLESQKLKRQRLQGFKFDPEKNQNQKDVPLRTLDRSGRGLEAHSVQEVRNWQSREIPRKLGT